MCDKRIETQACPVCKGLGSVGFIFAPGMRPIVSRCGKCGGTGTVSNADRRS